MLATPDRKLMLIDGKWEASADGRFLPVENPAQRRVIAEVPRGGAADVERAVQAAGAEAQPGFIPSRRSLKTRLEHWIAGTQH